MATTTPASSAPLRIAIPALPDGPVRNITGELLCGTVNPGDRIFFSPDNLSATVISFELDASLLSLILEQEIVLSGPCLASHEDNLPIQTDVFVLKVTPPLQADKISTDGLKAMTSLGLVDLSLQASTDQLAPDEVVVRTSRVIAIDEFADNRITGACTLLTDGGEVARAEINMKGYADQRELRTVRATNITRVNHRVSEEDRTEKYGHTGAVLWLTGLSGSGKSTLAVELETELFHRGYQVYVLDGDNIRHGLNANLGFSPEDRSENIRRVGEVAALFARAGFIAISAFISPYQSDRERARAAAEDFHEIFVSADLATCEQRDPKGLYVKARKGEIPDFTGISAPYEEPDNPALTVDTGALTVDQSVQMILDYIVQNFETANGNGPGPA